MGDITMDIALLGNRGGVLLFICLFVVPIIFVISGLGLIFQRRPMKIGIFRTLFIVTLILILCALATRIIAARSIDSQCLEWPVFKEGFDAFCNAMQVAIIASSEALLGSTIGLSVFIGVPIAICLGIIRLIKKKK